MRLLRTEIAPLINHFFYVDVREQAFLACPFHTQPSFHSHAECELVLIQEGFGKRIIGNKVESFGPGDLVLIGSELPHVWLSDQRFYEANSPLKSKVIVIYLHPKAFQQTFDCIKEFESVKNLFSDARKGIRVTGNTRMKVAEKMLALPDKNGFDKIISLLEILNQISVTDDREFILEDEMNGLKIAQSDKLAEVIRYIKDNFSEPLSLKKMAEIACMTEQSFCRYFKTRTKKGFSQYLTELRIQYACKLLIETEEPISNIALSCGFNSSSHFCKVFRDQIGKSPFKFKANVQEEQSMSTLR